MSRSDRVKGATATRRDSRRMARVLGLRHWENLVRSLAQLKRRPFSSLMTAAVIGIALALPAGLQALVANLQAVTEGWDSATQISLFLKRGLAESDGRRLAEEIRRQPGVKSVRYISAAEALAEFERLSGFGAAVESLGENPLPAVLVVQPGLKESGAAAVGDLAKRLGGRPEVELAQLDVEWVQRLYALLDLAVRGVWILASFLALAVLFVVGNTIRLAIQNQRDEIVVSKLIGATDAFIRRPFLYTGLWYGLAGGLIAVGLVSLSLALLNGPATRLAALYDSHHALQGLAPAQALFVVASGAALGLLGSWLAVGRHLREIEPG